MLFVVEQPHFAFISTLVGHFPHRISIVYCFVSSSRQSSGRQWFRQAASQLPPLLPVPTFLDMVIVLSFGVNGRHVQIFCQNKIRKTNNAKSQKQMKYISRHTEHLLNKNTWTDVWNHRQLLKNLRASFYSISVLHSISISFSIFSLEEEQEKEQRLCLNICHIEFLIKLYSNKNKFHFLDMTCCIHATWSTSVHHLHGCHQALLLAVI